MCVCVCVCGYIHRERGGLISEDTIFLSFCTPLISVYLKGSAFKILYNLFVVCPTPVSFFSMLLR